MEAGQDIYYESVSLEEARSIWIEALRGLSLWAPLRQESAIVYESLGRITAAPIYAKLSSPFFHASAMDGYAVRFNESFGAAETSPIRLKIGSDAIYVDTGDPVPDGFNAVVMVEDARVFGEHIEITSPLTPWKNVRTVGEDIVATELIVPENHRIRAVDIGALLAGGLTEIPVRARPKVAIIPTGTEIVEPGAELKRGDIIEFNSRVLAALVQEWGGEPVRMEIVPDNQDKLEAAIKRAAAIADLVVTNAGASAGSEDFTAKLIKKLGRLLVHGIRIKPGRPAMLGIIDNKPVIGTPGYPVAAYLTFNLFARPLVRKWLGLEDSGYGHGTIKAAMSRQVASPLGIEEFLRIKVGSVGGRRIATPIGKGAGITMSLVRADGVMMVPAMSEGLGAGQEVEIDLIRPSEEIERTVVSIGSHDICMDILASCLKKRHPRLALSSAHVGSMGGLMALKKGEAHIAPTHLLDEETGVYNRPFTDRVLPDMDVVLVNVVYRTQGLMVPRGNPKGIHGIQYLTRPDLTYINRQRGAGTRLLLDKRLRDLGIDPSRIQGYNREEYTHMSVASAVLTGVADTGLGVLSAANALGLDFIPIAGERYDLAIPRAIMGDEHIAALLEVIRMDVGFRSALEQIGGYDLKDMGKEV